MFLLTAVDQVAVNWGTPKQQWLSNVDAAQMEDYIAQHQFAPGSMLPKVEASIEFVKGRQDRAAYITSLPNLTAALKGKVGTRVVDKAQ